MLSNRISNNHTIWCRKSSYRNKIEMHYMKRRSLISNYYYWKPLKNIVSIKITLTCFGNKYFLRIFADKRLWVLNISVAKICKFLWCIETDLFKKWKKKQNSLYEEVLEILTHDCQSVSRRNKCKCDDSLMPREGHMWSCAIQNFMPSCLSR